MLRILRSLWTEPAVDDPPPANRWEWLFAAALTVTAVLEAIFRTDLVWPVPSLIITLALVPTVVIRRQHPLAVVLFAFFLNGVVEVVSQLRDVDWEGLYTTAFVLLLIYSLFRWASGRHAVIGLVMVAFPLIVTSFEGDNSVGDTIGGIIIILVMAELGAAVRYQDNSRTRRLAEIRERERKELARELHDTVAHHVSAIAVQAQAGRTVGVDRPDAALDALATIEEAASRTLEEMRSIVGALRDDDPEMAPGHTLADIEKLAPGAAGGPVVSVTVSGDLAGLRPSVEAAAFRVAQESVTNAVRHARFATSIGVDVVGDGETVRLRIEDDGLALSNPPTPGHGLVGMSERVALLGGRISAGPGPDRGFVVEAELPKRGAGAALETAQVSS